MKQCFRMFAMLLVATLASTTAFAEEWNIPQPKASEMVLEDTFAIRNVGQNAYLYMGEAWGTQGIVDVKNGNYLLIRPEQVSVELEDGEYTVIALQDNSKGWGTHYIWRQPADGNLGAYKGCFVDNGSGTTARYWNVASVGNNVYTIQIPSQMVSDDETLSYFEGEFLGIQTDHGSTWAANNAEGVTYGIYYDVVYADNPANCQWEFVTKDALDAYNLKLKLVTQIEDAEANNIDASAARAIIPNVDATYAQVKEIYDALEVALREADKYNHPDDVTDQYIVNYKPVSNTNGWETPEGQPNAFDPGNDNAEFWQRSGYSLRQTIHNLPAGVYMLRAIAMTRTDYESFLAAGDVSMKIATVDAGEVNNRAQANAWFNAGNGVNDLTFMQEAEGDVEISLTADKTAGDHWTVWRSFQLFFRGDNADAIGKAAKALTENWEEEFVDRIYSQTYYDAVTAGIAASEAASTSEDAIAAYVATRDALTALRANADAYEALKARAEEVYEIIWDQLDGDDILLEMIEGAGDDAGILANIEDGAYTTEEAVAKLDELNERVNWVNNNLMQPGDDVTEKFVENYTFRNAAGTASGFNKWVVDSDNALQNNAGSIQVVEQWNGTSATSMIDVYQYINVAKGAYRLSTKGWYRSTTDYNTYKTNPDYQTVKSYLYGSASQFPFPDIYVRGYTDEEKAEYFPNGNSYTATIDGVTYYYPNNCTGADELFTNENVDWYDMYVDFIATGEPVKIGIKGTVVGYAWTIWDDFKLTFLGKEVEDMLPVAKASIDEAKALLEYPMSNEARQRLNAAIAAAEGATDGNALIDAYVALGAVKDATQASIDTYSKLKAENEKLAQAIIDYADKASDEALANANALNAEIQEGLAAGSYTDEQVQEQIDRIADAIIDLQNVVGTDYPIDYTARITNPKYLDGKNGWSEAEGFEGVVTVEQQSNSEGNIGIAEGWNKGFEIFQEIKRLPEGSYRVSVRALYRQEGTGVDTKIWRYGYAESLGKLDMLAEADKTDVPEFDPRAKLFANGDSVDLARWIFIPENEDDKYILQGADGDGSAWTAIEDTITDAYSPVTYYYPNMRVAAANRFEFPGFYENEVVCYVDNTGLLKLGLSNKNGKSLDWVPFSDWKLEYLGPEDPIKETTGVGEIAAREIINNEIFTTDGRRVNTMVKGINIIKTTDKDGKAVVKKVIVK
ncbi:MAG: hypothetical protein IKX24_07790 [Prevotella sp.]|nr:hypothetical protein [Prevotella sp.]